MVVAGRQDDLFARIEMSQRYLQIQSELGDRRTEAVAQGNLGVGWLELGELGQARNHLEAGLTLYRAVGDRASESHVLANLSELAQWQDDDALALAHARTALDLAQAAKAQLWETVALRCLGNAELGWGAMRRRTPPLSAAALCRARSATRVNTTPRPGVQGSP